MMDLPGAYRGTRVLVTGASGFIGRHLSRALAGMGSRPVFVAREQAPLDALRTEAGGRCTAETVDLADAAAVTALVDRVQPAVVFNLAGYGVNPAERDEAAATRVNSDLPELLAAAMANHGETGWTGQHVVHAGSALEYGTATGDLNEQTPGTPTTQYGRTKLAGTQRLNEAARRLGVRAVTGRLFMVYGPGERSGRLLPSLITAAPGAESIPLSAGAQRRDFTYVDDVVQGLLRLGLLADNHVGPVNVATGRLTAVRAFVEAAAGHLRIAPERLGFGALPTRPEEMQHDPVSIARLRSLTGWVPAISIDEGIVRTISAGQAIARTSRY